MPHVRTTGQYIESVQAAHWVEAQAQAIESREERVELAFKITEDCISCGACEPECPNDAISEGASIYEIDPDKCTECVGFFDESQCALVCPVDACVTDPDYVETKEELLAKKVRLHPADPQ
jgi:ferredoxin